MTESKGEEPVPFHIRFGLSPGPEIRKLKTLFEERMLSCGFSPRELESRQVGIRVVYTDTDVQGVWVGYQSGFIDGSSQEATPEAPQ